MSRRRRRGRGAGTILLALAVLVAVPAYRIQDRIRHPAAGDPGLDETFTALARAEAEDSRRRLAEELRAATGFDASAFLESRVASRYQAFPADVLPLEDPAPLRHGIWLALEATAARARAGAVALEGFLVGRLEGGGVGSLARARTLLDPGFRVAFRSAETSGILHGTGRRERRAGGRPFLEAWHVTPVGSLSAGATVVTAGGDGVFAPGLVIGEVTAEGSEAGAGKPIVRAARAGDDLRAVVVIIDAVSMAASRTEGGSW